MGTYYREQRALSNDDTMMTTICHPRTPPLLGLITPPHTPPPIDMDDMDLDHHDLDFDPTSLGYAPSAMPADAFPHIVEAIFAHAPNLSLASLRGVCRSFRDRADALLLQHVVLQDGYEVALPGGGPVRADWLSLNCVRTLDVVDLDLVAPPTYPLSPVQTLRAHSVERWRAGQISLLPPSNTLVLFGRLSDMSYGPDSANWAPYIARNTQRLVAHYNARAPELGAWGAVGAALTLRTCRVRDIVFIFAGEADEVDVSLLGALLMLTMQLGWHTDDHGINGAKTSSLAPITLVNALPWFAAGVDRGEAFKGDSEGDVVALFLRAAGFGRAVASDDELKARYEHYFKFTTFNDYRRTVGEEEFAFEMNAPLRVGAKPDRWCPKKDGAVVSVRPARDGRRLARVV